MRISQDDVARDDEMILAVADRVVLPSCVYIRYQRCHDAVQSRIKGYSRGAEMCLVAYRWRHHDLPCMVSAGMQNVP